MKKQNLKSLSLKRNTISNFSMLEVNGGITGGACASHGNSACCPQTVVHTCNYSDERTCTLSIIQCTG